MSKRFYRLKKEVGLFVLNRCNNKCTNCGTSYNLCVHHVVRMSPDHENYNDVNNLTVLCRSCHMSHHRNNGEVISPPPPPGNKYGRRGKIPPIICKEIGCNILQYGRGYCKKHYEYKRRRGQL